MAKGTFFRGDLSLVCVDLGGSSLTGRISCALISMALLGLMMTVTPYGIDKVYAQRSPGEAEAMSSRLINDARSYYDNLEMDPMDEALERIIEMSRRFGNISPRFSQNLAQAFILKGLLAFVNSDDRGEARRLFVKAIEASSTVRLSEDLSTPDLRQIFEDARRSARPAPNGGGYTNTYGRPQQPANPYGQPAQPPQPANSYGRPTQPANPYGQPAQPANPYGQPAQPANPYGQPAQPANPYGRPAPPANPYGQPAPPANTYGQPAQPANPYGQPAQPANPYGQPAQPANPYGQPSQPAAQPAGPEVSHTPPPQLPGGRPFTVRVRVSPYLRPQVFFARLFYVSRGTGGITQKLDLRPSGEYDFDGLIRGEYVSGERLQYFITFYDQSDSPIASFKNHRTPQVVRVVGGQYANLIGGGGLVGGASPKSNKIITARLSAGFGTGSVEEGASIKGTNKLAEPGFALSGVHTRFETEFWIIDNLSVGISTRLQFDQDPPIAAFLAGGLLHWIIADDSTNRWGLRLGGGFGKIAHLIPVQPQSMNSVDTGEVVETPQESEQTFTFLTFAGPIYYQLGLSYALQLSNVFAITFNTDFLHMIALQSPPEFPSKHFDFSLGIEFTL